MMSRFGRKKSPREGRDRGSFVVDKETAVDGERSSFTRDRAESG